MKTLKEKYDSIDQSKISAEQKSFLDKIKKVTNDFKSKDKEVNDKVEGALDKMIATFKEKMPEAIKGTSSAKPKKRNTMSVAKEIRKEGESFTEAKKRASKKIADDKADAKETIKSELDKLNAFIKSRKKLADIKGTDLLRDSKRKAKPVGKRISKTGKVYYEYRDSKTDRLSPSYPKNAPYLAGGGGVEFKPYGKTKGRYKITYLADGKKQSEIWETLEMAIDNAKRYKKIEEFSQIEVFDENGKKIMALGGSVVTDLAGHQDGTFGVGNHGMLDGFSGTNYTGLVGETGAMSSGELFMDGGAVGIANQQVIDNASQSYVNYYLGEGASAGIFAKGGAIKNQYAGRTPEDIWDSLSVEQRKHFLLDHYYINEEEFEQLQYKRLDAEDKEMIDYYANRTWKKLSGNVRKAFTSHVKEGQYAKGGGVRKVGNREYSYGRNWTNDHRHTNKNEEHEVKYTRKGKFLGVFADGGEFMTDPNFGNFQNNIYADGGLIGREVDFIRHGEKGRGIIGEINDDGSFAVATNNSIRLVEPDDVIKIHDAPKKSRWFFKDGGGLEDNTPKIYVADLEAYNNGRLVGVWLDLTDYEDAEELMDAISRFLKESGGEEFAIHDYENLPSSMYSEYMGERDFQQIYDMIDLAKDKDLPLDVIMEIVSQFDESALDEYQGSYDSAVDFAEQLVDDIGGLQMLSSPEYYIYITETDRRLLSQEMADAYVDDIRSEDEGRRLIEEGGLDIDEFEEADEDRKEEMLDEARENVYDEYYDSWYMGLSDPYSFLVEEQGIYSAEDFFQSNLPVVDYEKLATELEFDYTFIRHDGQVYVFNIR